ncbi:rhamnose/proton symporter RhaT [Algoriphagus sp. H41]|uniref:Rhamnose/proton symporter RhaT n=1 Tax=Algoriphagus oliviformis TaxID=2811231 RepID=A0ABS3C8B0_9BACT|nr:L-rhamnose/proton symporter RhaT [Algoriphagus oliviformis]MBN7813351.1 rhamnose/proton symporter RhaT [Algoriphagus oliviformis]
MDSFVLAFALVLFASFFQGTFGLGMKYITPLKWEAWWLVYSVIAMVLFPVGWALLVVPDLWEVILSSPEEVIFMAMLFGFLWGIGGILFGVSVEYTGISITYGIVMGLAASVGSIIPFFQIQDAFSQPSFPVIMIGVGLLLVGVFITALAGINRDKVRASASVSNPKSIGKGVAIAVTSGVLSALLNVGFSNASAVAEAAADTGVSPQNASLAAWVVVLVGAFIMNAGYSISLLFRNNSWSSFGTAYAGKSYLWAILSGLFWFAALGVYGQGAALLGDLGPVVGWPILLGLALIISNVWAYRSGEWDNAKKPFRQLLKGLAVLILAVCLLGYANYL